MFKRISIILIALLTILCFVSSAGAVDAGLFVLKDSGNTYIDYVDADDTTIMKIDDTDGVYIETLSVGTTTTTTSYTSMNITSTLDASSLTTASIVTAGGVAIAGQLFLGDDLDMTVNGTGTYEITLQDGVADALSITREGVDIMVFDTSTPRVTITPVTTITGALTATGGITVGAALVVGTSGAGETVTFYGDNANSNFVWTEDGESNGSLILGATTDGVDFRVYGTTATTYLHWDNSVDDLLLVGAVARLLIAGDVDTSLTDAAIVVTGGIACTKQLWLGDDIDMSTSGDGVYEITLRNTVNDALSIVAGSDLMVFDTDNDRIVITPPLVIAGLVTTSSTTGFRSDPTFSPDQLTTNYAFAVGQGHADTNELDVTMGGGANQNFDPFQMNVNIVGQNPGGTSTTNLFYAKLTHDYVNMSNLRLKCADFTVEVGENVKDAYAYQGEILFTSDVAIGGEACVLGLVLNVGSGTVSGSVSGIHMALRGSAMSACQAYGFYMSVGDSATATNGIYIETQTGGTIGNSILLGCAATTTITRGLYIHGAGTFTTGIVIGDSCTQGITSLAPITVGVDGTGYDVTFYGGLAGSFVLWDASEDRFVVQNTFAADGDVSTYEYGMYVGMVFNTDATTGKYISGIKIAMEGTGDYDSGSAVWPLWIDIQNSGTSNSAHFDMIRLSIQAGAAFPDNYISYQTASPGVDYLYEIVGDVSPWVGNAGTYTTADGYIKIMTPDGARRIAVYAAVD